MRRPKWFTASPPPIVEQLPASAALIRPPEQQAPAHLDAADATVWRQFALHRKDQPGADEWASITQAERDGRRAYQAFLDRTRNYQRAMAATDTRYGVAATGRDHPVLRA